MPRAFKRKYNYNAMRARAINKRRRPYSSKVTRRPRRGARANIKSIALGLSESKRNSMVTRTSFVNDVLTPGAGLFHNTIARFDLLSNQTSLMPSQGSAQNERNGSDIYGTGIMLRGEINIPYDRRNARFKIYICEFNNSAGNPSTYSNFFKDITGSAMLDQIDNDRFNARPIANLRCTARDLLLEEGKDATVYFKKWIPFKRHLKFNTGNTAALGMKEILTLLVIPYDTYTTIATDRLATTFQMAATFYYKDP